MRWKTVYIITIILFSSCNKELGKIRPDDFGPPVVRLSVSPQLADSTTWFVLSGAGSHDAENMWGIIDFRWDLDNDGTWDTPYTDKPEWVHVFPEPGIHWVKLEVKDRFEQTSIDSVKLETYGSIKDTSHFRDPRDGQVYKTVQLYGITWMAENLNYGQMIPVKDTARDNGVVEKYCYLNDSLQRGEQGGAITYYHWMEMMNHDTCSQNGICPPGWELPTIDDWRLITDSAARPFYFFAVGGFSNLNLTRTGFYPLLQDWSDFYFSIKTSDWTYFTRTFYEGYLNGPDRIIPFVASSQTLRNRGNIYAVQYYNDTIRKYMGIAPVRCIKRN